MLTAAELGKLKWRCRRGLLENDLLIQRFFSRHESALSVSQAQGLARLMELPDPELLDLLLARSEPAADLDCSEVHEVLKLLRIDPKTERH